MIKNTRHSSKRQRPITSADLGRYIKQVAILNRDAHTGNPALSEALLELAQVLIAGKANPVHKVAAEFSPSQESFEFGDLDFENLPIEQVRELLNKEILTKSDLVIIGTERFGIARSRLEKLPREEIVKTISAAAQHEESLTIISEEAKRGGQLRSS